MSVNGCLAGTRGGSHTAVNRAPLLVAVDAPLGPVYRGILWVHSGRGVMDEPPNERKRLGPGSPPFRLVQLHEIPVDEWVGKPVFHPGQQRGATAYWTRESAPGVEGEDPGPQYDVGVVVRWEADAWEPDDSALHDVWFLIGDGCTLRYSAWNLWVPVDPR